MARSSSGRNPNCSKCGLPKDPSFLSSGYCRKCKTESNKTKRLKARLERGQRPLGEGRSLYCYECKAIKENPKQGYCNACHRKRDNEWRLRTGRTKKHQTGLCPCGDERAPGNHSYCQFCANKQSREWRRDNGWKPEEIERQRELQRARYKSVSKGRIRRNGTLINGVKISCDECDKLSEGWCDKCNALYERLKLKYHEDDQFKLKVMVRALTRSYIRAGVLVKQDCEFCKSSKNVEAHHEDYSKPMDVIWLCRGCHKEWHDCLKMSDFINKQFDNLKGN